MLDSVALAAYRRFANINTTLYLIIFSPGYVFIIFRVIVLFHIHIHMLVHFMITLFKCTIDECAHQYSIR